MQPPTILKYFNALIKEEIVKLISIEQFFLFFLLKNCKFAHIFKLFYVFLCNPLRQKIMLW